MPSGPPELHEYWSGVAEGSPDGNALTHLTRRGFNVSRGGIITPPADHELSAEDISAIDYLFMEWDYAYEADATEKAKGLAGEDG